MILLFRVMFDVSMCLCILKFNLPYDKIAPSTHNHSESTLLSTIYTTQRNSRISKAQREGFLLRHLHTVWGFCFVFVFWAWNSIMSTVRQQYQDKRFSFSGKHVFPEKVECKCLFSLEIKTINIPYPNLIIQYYK